MLSVSTSHTYHSSRGDGGVKSLVRASALVRQNPQGMKTWALVLCHGRTLLFNILHDKTPTKHNSASKADLGTICHLKSADPCNIRCSHVKQMGSGRAGCIDDPAKSNFLSFNEGWRKRLIKCPLITSLFLCVSGWPTEKMCLCWWKGNLPSSIFLDKLELLKAILFYCEFIWTVLNKESTRLVACWYFFLAKTIQKYCIC